jgi:hypothetical protein
MKTLINNLVVTALVAAYQAAKRLSLIFALSGYEIDQIECWNDRSLKLRMYVGIQDGLRGNVTMPLRAAIEVRVGGEFLIINGKIVLR